MAQADTLKWWNATAAVRQQQPITSGVVGKVRACGAKDFLANSDLVYTEVCPPPWLEYPLSPSYDAVQLCFPTDYFAWCQQYLAALLKNQPAATASAEARVTWTLDVWAHVNYALWALNIDWSQGANAGVGERVEAAGPPLIFAFGPKKDTLDTLTLERLRVEAAARESGDEDFRGWDVSNGVWLPITVTGVKSYFARMSTKTPNPRWARLLEAMQPWNSTWPARWFDDGKDANDVRMYAGDPPLIYAVNQWRLYTFYWDSFPGAWRYQTLSSFIVSVSQEPTGNALVPDYKTKTLYTTFQRTVQKVVAQANVVLGLDYKVVMSSVLAETISSEAPKFNDDGTPMTINQWRTSHGSPPDDPKYGDKLLQQAVTYEDWRDFWQGNKDAYTARAQYAIVDPSILCEPKDLLCQESAKYAADIRKRMKEIPGFGDIVNAIEGLAILFVGLIGGAIGNAYFPMRPIAAPVARTLSMREWSFAPNGSTMDLWVRWGLAVENYERMIPGLFSSTPPQKVSAEVAAKLKAEREGCTTYSAVGEGREYFCDICEGKVLPSCAQHVPKFAQAYREQQARLLAPAGKQPSQAAVEACNALAFQWFQDNPQYADCVDGTDLPAWNSICWDVSMGTMTPEQGIVAWAQYLVKVKQCGLRPVSRGGVVEPQTAWGAFRQGLQYGTNPFEQVSSTGSFVDRVLVPFNPFRWFGG